MTVEQAHCRSPIRARVALAPAIAALIITACTALPTRHADVSVPDTPRWQRVRFQIHWNRAEPPQWHVDAMLAHAVVAPILERERSSIILWRFHRRAADDAVGHALSLLSYAPPATNVRLCNGLESDQLAAAMGQAGVIDKIECLPLPADSAPLVEASSDRRWSLALQRAWPYFIMGASELWLRLIDEHVAPADPDQAPSLDGSLARYRAASDAVTQVWQREGHHALLHHLNALFGYGPIDVGKGEQRRF